MRVLGEALSYLGDGAHWRGDDGLTHLLLQQLLITFTTLALAMTVGLPVALWLGHRGRFGFLAINVSNVGRAVPTFALLGLFVTADSWRDGIGVPDLMPGPWDWSFRVPIHLEHFPGTMELGPYGRAGAATLVALALFALPPLITNAYVAMREVPGDVLEAADGMGMSSWQRFWRIELPLGLPLVVSGIRLALVQVWATATVAALVAGPGLGQVITDGFYRTNYAKGIAGAMVVAAVALLLELAAALAQRLLTPASRARRARASGPMSAPTSTVTP